MVIIHYMYNNSFHKRRSNQYNLLLNTQNIKTVFSGCADFEIRTIDPGLKHSQKISVCWLDGTVSGADVSQNILRPLTQAARCGISDTKSLILNLIQGAVYSYSVSECRTMDEFVSNLTHGHCAVVFDDELFAVSFEVKSSAVRSVSEPTLEKSVKGAKDSFVEVLRTNTSLLRRRIASPELKILETTVGRKSNTGVALIYYDGIASIDTVNEALRRLDEIDIDAALSVGSIEKRLIDHPSSPLPQLIHTERPDRMAMYLMDGRIGLLIDGLPVGLVLPVTLAEYMKVIGDSNMHHLVSNVLTILRYFSLLLSLLLPALYVAIAMYHQEMIPTKLLVSIVDAKKDVPFSSALEIIGMLAAFAMLQEAGLRLPDPVGDTVSIIGALIVGQSAVEARLVSPIAIIIVAVSGIACYTLPSQDLGSAVRISRLILLFAAIFAGLFGVGAGCCVILLHMSGIDSFGINYTAPLSSSGLRKLLFRPPAQKDKYRDPLLNTPDRRRQK